MHVRWGMTAVMFTLIATPVLGVTPPQCETAKLKGIGKYGLCRLKAAAKAVQAGGLPDFSKCDGKVSNQWSHIEITTNGMCPATGDLSEIQQFIAECTDDVAAAVAGGSLPPPGPVAATGQTTSYGPGSDGDLQNGSAHTFIDNFDGTISDTLTGLMWEKKSRDGSIHDMDNAYTWSGASYGDTNIMDGTITTTFLAELNSGGGFAGYTDWRIPNLNELESIRNVENVQPATYGAFNQACTASCTVLVCSCTQPNDYWSSTTYQLNANGAWFVNFYDGNVGAPLKSGTRWVRAVRGGH